QRFMWSTAAVGRSCTDAGGTPALLVNEAGCRGWRGLIESRAWDFLEFGFMSLQGARLWVVRHGETDWNVERRVQGHTPTHLNENGRAQARGLREFFAGRWVGAAYASDLPRAYETAEIIMEGRGVEVVRKAGLRERSLGRYEGMLSAEVHAARTALGLEQSGDLADWARMPGCEGNAELFERAMKALKEISDAHAGQDVLVVCHG